MIMHTQNQTQTKQIRKLIGIKITHWIIKTTRDSQIETR